MSPLIYGLSRALAWFGALVLCAIALMSAVSIAGRALAPLGLGPVPGDFELVEAGAALAIFCFLPWCHLQRGHATVDLFWGHFPARLRHAVEVLAEALMLTLWALLVWRMGIATLDYRGNGEVSFILQMPVWWGYGAAMLPAIIGCAVYAWRLLETLGLALPPAGLESSGAGH